MLRVALSNILKRGYGVPKHDHMIHKVHLETPFTITQKKNK